MEESRKKHALKAKILVSFRDDVRGCEMGFAVLVRFTS
jgi:hypothetical protein